MSTLPTQSRIDDLVDTHGSIQLAIQARQACVDRRAGEGKASPVAEAEVAALKGLPWDHLTARQREAQRNQLPHDYLS